MNLRYQYSIDVFSSSYLSGWVRHRFNAKDSLTLIIKAEDTILGECVANMLREDVRAQRLHPTGLCGFSFQLPISYIASESKDAISIIVKDSGVLLDTIGPHLLGQVLQPKLNFWNRFKLFVQPTSKRSTTFFMHIPKTAGTSFNSFACSLYNSHETITHIEAFDRTAYTQIANNYKFISGHLRVDSIKNYFTHKDIKLYTLIREPYAHLHSHLNWLRKIGSNPDSDFYKAHHGLLKNLANQFGDTSKLTHLELQAIVDNMTGLLSKFLDNYQSRHFLATDPEKIGTEHWEEIKSNIKIFTLIGRTEQYAAYKKEFCSHNYFSEPLTTKPLNKSNFSQLYDHTDPTTREIVQSLVSIDLQLYDEVQKINP